MHLENHKSNKAISSGAEPDILSGIVEVRFLSLSAKSYVKEVSMKDTIVFNSINQGKFVKKDTPVSFIWMFGAWAILFIIRLIAYGLCIYDNIKWMTTFKFTNKKTIFK